MARLLRILAWCVFLLLASVALVYVGEDAIVRYRVSHGGSAQLLENLTVYQAGAVKGGKLEYYFDQPQVVTCVHAVFPHLGDPPCWYARKHTIKVLSRLVRPRLLHRGFLAAASPHAGRSSKLDVIWMAPRSERYTGHCIANVPCTRSIVSRFSSPATIANAT